MPDPAPLTREEAIERLARQLYWTHNRLDPPDDPAPWEDQNEVVRHLYRELIEDILLNTEALERAMSDA